MGKEEIIRVLSNYETIHTTLEEMKKKSSVVPSMSKFLKLLLIERLDGIKEELDGLRDMLAIYLDEQEFLSLVEKADAHDAQEFLND